MFYNPELLTKPKSRLGIVWLAATIGNRSSFKKLSKADVGSVNLVKICRQLAAPDEAMALRLSSQLLYGTVRIYDQQLDSLQRAAEATQMALKRSFLSSTTGVMNAEVSGLKIADPSELTMSKRSSAAAITLKPNEYCYVGEFFFDYAQELGRVLGKDPQEIYQEQGFGSSASDSQRGQSTQPSRHRAASEQARELSYSNTRKPWQLKDAGLAAAFSGAFADSPSDQGLGLGLGGAFDFDGADVDLGLFDGLDDELNMPFAPPKEPRSRAGSQGAADAEADRAIAEDVEMAQLDLEVIGTDKNRGGILAQAMVGGEAGKKRDGSNSDISLEFARREGRRRDSSLELKGDMQFHAGDAMMFDFGADAFGLGLEGQLPSTPAQSEGRHSGAGSAKRTRDTAGDDLAAPADEGEAAAEGGGTGGLMRTSPRRKRTRTYTRKIAVDKRTQLTQDEMRASRQDYVKRQAEIRAKQDAAKRQKAVDQWVHGMMGVDLFGPQVEPWAGLVAEVLVQKDDEWAAFKASAQADYAKKGGTVYGHDAVETLASAVLAAVSHSPALSQAHRDFDVGRKGLSEKAKGKQRAISPRSPAMRSLGFNELGQMVHAPLRKLSGSQGKGRQSSLGPDFGFGMSGAGDAIDFGMFDSGSMADGGNRSRHGSMGPLPIFNASRQGSVPRNFAELDDGTKSSLGLPRHMQIQNSPLPGFVPWSQSLDEGGLADLSQNPPSAFLLSPGAASFGRRSITPAIGQFSRAGSLAPAGAAASAEPLGTQTTATESQVERDLNNFMKYAKKLSVQRQDGDDLLLSDIAPVGMVSRSTACKAFYNTLVLSTSGNLSVKQKEPYGPVAIRL